MQAFSYEISRLLFEKNINPHDKLFMKILKLHPPALVLRMTEEAIKSYLQIFSRCKCLFSYPCFDERYKEPQEYLFVSSNLSEKEILRILSLRLFW